MPLAPHSLLFHAGIEAVYLKRVIGLLFAAAVLFEFALGTAEESLPPSSGSDDSFKAQVFNHSFSQTIPQSSTGDFYKPAYSYPPIEVDSKFRHALTFQMSQFFPARREALPGNGPLVLFSDDLDTIVFSPLDHFYVSLIDFKDGRIHYGIEGDVDAIPAGFTHRFILVKGKGINNTLRFWGERLRAVTGKAPVDRYADVGLSYLGYWTDAGAAYYWKTMPGKNHEETLLAVKAEADSLGIPYKYFQIDSWWYYTKRPGLIMKGSKRWEPRPDVFPDGLPAFRRRLGLPLVAHTRWFGPDNDHAAEYPFIVGRKVAIPKGRDFYDQIMAKARSWGIVTYEQDWLMGQFWWMDHLRNGVDHVETWLGNMDDAARDHGLTMQICMAGAAHVMDSVNRKSWTTVRSSIDYRPGYSKESYWPQFHIANMIVDAIGLRPFKDNFRTAEKHGEAEALISNLSAGMVGPSDEVGEQDAKLLMRTCRSDGLLLKPDGPALPIDAMFFPHERPFITVTHSKRPELGEWTYLAAYHFARRHPDRRLLDRLYARITYDCHEMGRFFVFPNHVTDWHVDLAEDLGRNGPVVAYDWRRGKAMLVEDGLLLPEIKRLYDFDYMVLAPVFDNGLALIGEKDKFVTLADKRFQTIEVLEDAIRIRLKGVHGERISIAAYDTDSDRLIAGVATISPDGTAELLLPR